MDEYLQKLDHFDAVAAALLPELIAVQNYEAFADALSGYLHARFMLEKQNEEQDIYALATLSIKSSLPPGGISRDAEKYLEKFDCHNTNSAVRKKVLFVMHLEKKLGVKLSDDEALDVESIDDLAKIFFAKLQGAKEGQPC